MRVTMSPLGRPVSPQSTPNTPLPELPELAPPPRGTGWRLTVLLVGLALLAGVAGVVRSQRGAAQLNAVIRTVRLQRGALRASLKLNGTIATRKYASIIAPRLRAPDTGRGLTLTYLVNNGAMVKKRQVVARIDGQSIADHLDDVESQIKQVSMDILSRRARMAQDAESLDQSDRAALASLRRAELEYGASPIRNPIDQQLLKLGLDEAAAKYEEIHEELNTLADRQEVQTHLLQLSYENQLRHRQRHQADLDAMNVLAPMDGQAILRSTYRNGQQRQVQLGDQLAPGQPFLRVVDLAEMQVEATVNQAEITLVRVGQPATVRLDAFPDVVLNGRVDALGAMASGGRATDYFIRTIPVRIAIEGSDPHAMPDFTASADVILAEEEDAVIAPREAIHESGGRQVVYVKHGETFEEREVQVGARSNTQAAVLSGVRAGEEIALQTPPPYGSN
jgi:HlyD family secretion protein